MGEQPRGFWISAAEEPARVAVLDADGRKWSAGEILGDANRIVHALRAQGLEAGDVHVDGVAVVSGRRSARASSTSQR